MKKITFTFLTLLFLGFTSVAQSAFLIVHNPANGFDESARPSIKIKTEITNLTGNTLNLKWDRNVLVLPSPMTTQICDPLYCYFEEVSTGMFMIAPFATDTVSIIFLNPTGQNQVALVDMVITNKDNLTDVQPIHFQLNPVVGTKDLPEPTVRFFPNPFVETFTLDNADAVANIRIFSMDGRQVAFMNANPGEVYTLNQPAGMYIMALEDDKGNVFQTVEVNKQ